jgi:hypothetical protein
MKRFLENLKKDKIKIYPRQFIGEKRVELAELSCQSIEYEMLVPRYVEEGYIVSLRGYLGNYLDTDFFNIYFSVIHNSFLDGLDNPLNSGGRFYPTTWRVDELDFFSFHDSILWLLLSKLVIKENNLKEASSLDIKFYLEEEYPIFFESITIGNLELLTLTFYDDYGYNDESVKLYQREIYNMISELTDDKPIVEFIKNLIFNLLEYKKYNFITLSENDFSSQKDENKIQNNIETLFCLLRDNRKIVLPFISESGLDKYFPNHCESSKKEILWGRCESNYLKKPESNSLPVQNLKEFR